MEAARTQADSQNVFLNLLNTKTKRWEFVAFAFVSLVVFFAINHAYSYPIITGDSGNYVLRAREMTIGTYRPFGYSFYLNLLHGLSTDIRIVFYGQYFLFFISTYFFTAILQQYLVFRRELYYTLTLSMLVSPALVYCTALVMSDILFYSMSLLYLITFVLWLRNDKWYFFVIHLLLLYFLMYTRYVALIYPLFTSVILLVNKFNRKTVLLAITPFLLALIFYFNIKSRMERQLNIEVFSGFSGWTLANNAVSVLPHVEIDLNEIRDPEIRYVHNIVSRKPDTLFTWDYVQSTTFMWGDNEPGKQLLHEYNKVRGTTYHKLWVYTGKLLSKYGKYLITHYPIEYFRYYLIPNAMELFSVFEINEWENSKTLNLDYFTYSEETIEYDNSLISSLYPLRRIVTALLWIAFSICLLLIIFQRKLIGINRWRTFQVVAFFMLIHCAMSVIAHPVNNFRYLLIIYPLQFLIVMIYADYRIENYNAKKASSVES